MRTMLKSKIHRARVTDANLHYQGSITLDPVLMEAADLLPYEQVHLLSVDNGTRLETYAIEGERDSGEVVVNGAAAHLIHKGDMILILSYVTVPGNDPLATHPRNLIIAEENSRLSVVESYVTVGDGEHFTVGQRHVHADIAEVGIDVIFRLFQS